jgi:hypothetical protein
VNLTKFSPIIGRLFATGFCIPVLTAWFSTPYFPRALRKYSRKPHPVVPKNTKISREGIIRFTLKKTAIGALAWLLTCAGSSEARDVAIGCSGRTIAETPYAWASKKGYFKEHNLDVKMIYMSTRIGARG